VTVAGGVFSVRYVLASMLLL